MRDMIAVLLICVIAAGVVFGVLALAPVKAATPAVPTCEAINQAGAITVYRCEPEYGLPYLINSMGFMVVED